MTGDIPRAHAFVVHGDNLAVQVFHVTLVFGRGTISVVVGCLILVVIRFNEVFLTSLPAAGPLCVRA